MKMSKIGMIGLIVGLLGGLAGIIAAIVASPGEGSIIAVIFISVFFSIFWFFIRPMISRSKLLKTGEQRQGKILEVWDTGVTINNDPQIGLLVEAMDRYGKPYSVKTKLLVSRLQVANVRPGLPVILRVDPRNDQNVTVETLGNLSGAPAQMEMDEYQKAMQKMVEQIDLENKDILLSGIAAEAKVIGYYDLNVKVNGDNPLVMLFVEVHPGLKEPFYADVKGVIAVQSIPKFQPGEMITVKYDLKNPRRVTVEHS